MTKQEAQIKEFLGMTKKYWEGEPKYTNETVTLILNAEGLKEQRRYDEIYLLVASLGGTRFFMPRPGFCIPLTKTPSMDAQSVRMIKGSVVTLSESPIIHQAKEGEVSVLNRFPESEMMPLPLTDQLMLPKSVLSLIETLKPNARGLYDQNGSLFIEVNLAVLQSIETFEAFLSFYRSTLEHYPGLKRYMSLYEKTQDIAGTHRTVTTNVYVKVAVLDLMLEKLIYFFNDDRDFEIPDALHYLLSHGINDADLQKTLNCPQSTYYRYKTGTPKMKNGATKTAKAEQPQINASANLAEQQKNAVLAVTAPALMPQQSAPQ